MSTAASWTPSSPAGRSASRCRCWPGSPASAEARCERAAGRGAVTETWSEKVPGRHRDRRVGRAGAPVRPGTAVALTVSKGPKPVPVPDWTGKSGDDAVAALRRRASRWVKTAPTATPSRRTPWSSRPRTGAGERGETVRAHPLAGAGAGDPYGRGHGDPGGREGAAGRRVQDPRPAGGGQLPRRRLRRHHSPKARTSAPKGSTHHPLRRLRPRRRTLG